MAVATIFLIGFIIAAVFFIFGFVIEFFVDSTLARWITIPIVLAISFFIFVPHFYIAGVIVGHLVCKRYKNVEEY